MSRKIIITLLSLFVFAFGVSAQSPPTPDSAYREFFVAVTADRATEDVVRTHIELYGGGQTKPVIIDPNGGPSERQLAYLRTAAHATDEEAAKASIILSNFRVKYDVLVTTYNNSPATRAGTNDNTPELLSNLEKLTQTTKRALLASLSASGVEALDRYVKQTVMKSEKQISFHQPSPKFSLASFRTPQSGCTLTPNYTSTTLQQSVTFDYPHTGYTYVYSSIGLSGYSTVSGNCGGVYTDGKLYNYWGTNTSGVCHTTVSTQSGWMSPTTYLSLSDAVVNVQLDTDLSIHTGDSEASVISSISTLLFDLKALFSWEIATTRFITKGYFVDTSSPPPTRDYLIAPYCTPLTSPPDYNPASPPTYFITFDPPGIPTDIVDGKTICARIASGPWSCAPVGKWINSYNIPYPLGTCTHNP